MIPMVRWTGSQVYSQTRIIRNCLSVNIILSGCCCSLSWCEVVHFYTHRGFTFCPSSFTLEGAPRQLAKSKPCNCPALSPPPRTSQWPKILLSERLSSNLPQTSTLPKPQSRKKGQSRIDNKDLISSAEKPTREHRLQRQQITHREEHQMDRQ